MKFLSGILALAFVFAGCSDDGSSKGPSDEAKGDETPITVGGKESGGDFKADCFDCAVDGPGAFVQTGISDKAFWSVGDTWQVVYQLHSDARNQKAELDFLQIQKPDVGIVALDFAVMELGEHTIGGQVRKTATIRITPGAPRGAVSQVIGANDIVQVDRYTKQIDLVINDLWQAVSVKEYNADYPNGRLIKADPRKALVNLDTAFPYVVPNAYVGAAEGPLPELSVELAEVAQAANSAYAQGSYFNFDLEAAGFNLSEKVYWAKGQPWPFLVETPIATGVLVSHNW